MDKIVNSPGQIEYIIREYRNGKTLSAIARDFRTSHVVIRKRLMENNIIIRRTWAKTTRECRHCHEIKSVDEFSYKKYVCKKCAPLHHRIKGYSFKKYGITHKEYKEILAKQNNKCALCGIEFTQTPHVDHDHTTGKVRGLLCGTCNTRIGMFDTADKIRRVIDYLSLTL